MMLCHCSTVLPLSCYFSSVICCIAFVMHAAEPCSTAFPPSCYFATVMLLCFLLAALPLSCSLPVSCHFASVTPIICLLQGCFASTLLLCHGHKHVTLPLSRYFASAILLCLCYAALFCLCQAATCSAITKIYPFWYI